MKTAGYSGTPLAKKLGIKEGATIQVMDAPKMYTDFFVDFPKDVTIVPGDDQGIPLDFIHLFATHLDQLAVSFSKTLPHLKKNGALWISWPKKTSGIPTELDKFKVMAFGREKGLVDTKVCAIDPQWSGHKFMYRKEDR